MIGVTLSAHDVDRITDINSRIKGYSGMHHYGFFKGIFEQFPKIKDVLILGVYQGRDINFMLDVLRRYHPCRDFYIAGVDKFMDSACEDWPKEKQGLNWEQAGFGDAPSYQRARDNISSDKVGLYHIGDEAFLSSTEQQFDFVYIDTSHDYETVSRQLKQVGRVCRGPETVIAGDDYSDEGTWGVKRAVAEGFTSHEVFGEWIWVSDKSKLKQP